MSMPVTVTIIAIPNDYNDVNELLETLSSQSIQNYQLVLMAKNQSISEFVDRNRYLIRTKDYVIDHSECEYQILFAKALSHSIGDYIWAYGNGDKTSSDFLETMLTIQRNIGADAIITNHSKKGIYGEVNDGRITVYHNPEIVPLRVPTIKEQWFKFFRRSLIEGLNYFTIKDIAERIIERSTLVCHYARCMFTFKGNTDLMFSTCYPMGCSWEMQYSKLMPLDKYDDSEKIPITIGICAYNEQYNIRNAINSIFDQNASCFSIDKVIIVSSGSTDDTDIIISDLSKEHDIIEPIFQKKRKGKNSAVNEIINNATTDVVVIYNADNVFVSEYSLDMLIRPFLDPKNGVTGGHPIPVNSTYTFPDYTIQLMWSVHHFVSMQSPNIGELIAFRRTDLQLPLDSQGDEGLIRAYLEKKGFGTVYVPEAMVYNRGPTTVREFLNQRKRVNIGEIKLKEKTGFKHPTHNFGVLANAFLASVRQFGVRPIKAVVAVSLETLARLLARMYVLEHKEDISIWDQVRTTKKL